MRDRPEDARSGSGTADDDRSGRRGAFLRPGWRSLLLLILIGCVTIGFAWRDPAVSADLSSSSREAAGAGHAASARSQSATRAAAEARLAQLVLLPIPYRNLYTLTDQLKLRPPRPIPHVVRNFTPNYPVGHEDNFEVLSEDNNGYFIMKARIVARTPHLYVYMQDGVKFNLSAAQQAANTFEHSIYPTDRSYYGSEWTPGVDHDPHITVLIGDLRSSGAAGFFSAEDEYPRAVNPYSNQREMIYINSTALLPGDPQFDQTLAHEFQHMIHWHMHPHDNAWLNEGMSMLAELLNGYPPEQEPSSFVTRPATQLNTWTLNGMESLAHYGAAYLYLTYLYDRYGRGLVREMLADGKYSDFELVRDVFHKLHISETPDQVFTQWVIANYIQDPSIDGGIYGYKQKSITLNYRVQPQHSPTLPFSQHVSLQPYAADYTTLSALQAQKPFKLTFSAPSSVPVIPPKPAPFWWTNRSDMSDTRLQRTVDLTHVRHASLHFKTWYDIEKDYDYAYVEASTDSGKTWTTLPGTHTTNANPNGGSYGNGYTGDSKTWQNETVDLSRYAGHRILLRFQYVTDDEYNGHGAAFRDIAIPEIHFRDTFTGWKSAGFVPVTINDLPEKWTVQLISYTAKGVQVQKVHLSANHGSVVIDPAKQGLKKLVVVVFSTAPKTTVKTAYSLSAGSVR